MDDSTLMDLFGSRSREIAEVQRDIGEVKDGIQRIETRLAKQGGIINGGARQITQLTRWSEEIDQMLAERDQKIADLTRRVDKLEGKKD